MAFFGAAVKMAELFVVCTVGENIIATTKTQKNYGAVQSFKFPIL